MKTEMWKNFKSKEVPDFELRDGSTSFVVWEVQLQFYIANSDYLYDVFTGLEYVAGT